MTKGNFDVTTYLSVRQIIVIYLLQYVGQAGQNLKIAEKFEIKTESPKQIPYRREQTELVLFLIFALMKVLFKIPGLAR